MSLVDWIVNVPVLEGVYCLGCVATKRATGKPSVSSGAAYQDASGARAWWIGGSIAALGVLAVAAVLRPKKGEGAARWADYGPIGREAEGAEGMTTESRGLFSRLEGLLDESRQGATEGVISGEVAKLDKRFLNDEKSVRRQLEDAYRVATMRRNPKQIEAVETRMRQQVERLTQEEERQETRNAGIITAAEHVERIEMQVTPSFAQRVAELAALKDIAQAEIDEDAAMADDKRRQRMASLGSAQHAEEQEALIREAREADRRAKMSKERLDAIRKQEMDLEATMDAYQRRVDEAVAKGRPPPPPPELRSLGMTVEEALAKSCARLEAARAESAAADTPAERQRRRDEEAAARARAASAAAAESRAARAPLRLRYTGTHGAVAAAQEASRKAREGLRAREQAEADYKAAFGVGTGHAPPVETIVVRRRS